MAFQAMIGDFANIILASLSLDRAYGFILKRKDEEARIYLRKKRFRVLDKYPESYVAIEYSLADMFLRMEAGEWVSRRGIIQNIGKSNALNADEKKLLIRYVLSVLWIGRGRSSECLLRIRQSIVPDQRLVRKILVDRYSNPDES